MDIIMNDINFNVIFVDVRTIDNDGATPVADYTPVQSTRITFTPGQQSYDLPITVADDGIIEGPESFRVVLFDPEGGALDQNSAADVRIIDDDFVNRE